jgi:hypothetical protein
LRNLEATVERRPQKETRRDASKLATEGADGQC